MYGGQFVTYGSKHVKIDKEGAQGFRNTRKRQAIARKGPIIVYHEPR